MAKHKHSEQYDTELDDQVYGAIDAFDFDEDELFNEFTKPEFKKTSRRKSKRAREARRLIEQYWEDKELRDSLDEYYFHTDD